ADVAEEQGLGSVELRECSYPLALVLLCPGVGDGRLQLARDELMKSARLLQRTHRVDAGNQHARRPLADQSRDRQRNGPRRRELRGAQVVADELLYLLEQRCRAAGGDCRHEPPIVPIRQVYRLRNSVGNARQAAGAAQLRLLAIDQIQQREGQIPGITLQSGCGGLTGRLGSLCEAALRRQGAQTIQLTVGNHPRRRLVGGAEDPIRQVLVITQRREGEGDVGLLQVTAALQGNEQILLARGLTGAQGDAGAGLEDLCPDLLPTHRDWQPERRRMPRRSADRNEGVVVEVDQLWTKGEGGRKAG